MIHQNKPETKSPKTCGQDECGAGDGFLGTGRHAQNGVEEVYTGLNGDYAYGGNRGVILLVSGVDDKDFVAVDVREIQNMQTSSILHGTSEVFEGGTGHGHYEDMGVPLEETFPWLSVCFFSQGLRGRKSTGSHRYFTFTSVAQGREGPLSLSIPIHETTLTRFPRHD